MSCVVDAQGTQQKETVMQKLFPPTSAVKKKKIQQKGVHELNIEPTRYLQNNQCRYYNVFHQSGLHWGAQNQTYTHRIAHRITNTHFFWCLAASGRTN